VKVPTEIDELVKSSGNSFHAKVARWFRDKGWHIVVSPYYMDQSQNKAREIDLIAEKLFPIKDTFGSHVDDLAVRLFVECKFVPTHSVFWFTDKRQDAARELVCSSGTFRANNTYTDEHHYLAHSTKVAKLFATSGNKAQENEPFYKALNQTLNAFVSMRRKPVSVPELLQQRRSAKDTLEFPVVVCSSFDTVFAVDFYADAAPEAIEDYFQLEVQYAYVDANERRRDEYFLLDFVAFKHLEQFAKAIKEDAEAAAFLLSR
jgi:hypothetical protein